MSAIRGTDAGPLPPKIIRRLFRTFRNMRKTMLIHGPIPITRKAAVLEAPRSWTLREIPVWPIEAYGDPDMVLVRVAACGPRPELRARRR